MLCAPKTTYLSLIFCKRFYIGLNIKHLCTSKDCNNFKNGVVSDPPDEFFFTIANL